MTLTAAVTIEDMLARVATGDRQAFRALYAKAGPRLYAICLRMMRSRDQADDVFQEVLVKVWEKSWQFDPAKGEALAWLVTLTRHAALDRLRRMPRQHVSLDDEPEVEAQAASAMERSSGLERRALHRCLAELRPDYREAVVLAYVNGLTHEELAARLDRPIGTIKSWVRRGLEQLKGCMDS